MIVSISAELAQSIRQHIQEIIQTASPAYRPYIQRVNALPLYGSFGGEWFIRPNGEVIILDWHTDEITVDPDTKRCYYMLRMGALRYPELQALFPPRPATAPLCVHCNGFGYVQKIDQRQQEYQIACDVCSGCGWVVPSLNE